MQIVRHLLDYFINQSSKCRTVTCQPALSKNWYRPGRVASNSDPAHIARHANIRTTTQNLFLARNALILVAAGNSGYMA